MESEHIFNNILSWQDNVSITGQVDIFIETCILLHSEFWHFLKKLLDT